MAMLFRTPQEAIAACPPPTGKIGIAIPDHTRPVDVGAALNALREVVEGDPVAVVGLGLHRQMYREELPISPFRLVQHDPLDTVPTGFFEDGVGRVPGGISAALAGCDALLSVGVVELHQYAGFSGGHKGVSVGCGSKATLDALHHRDRVMAPGVRIGRLANNPFREAVDALGRAAGCRWALVQSVGGWRAGPAAGVVTEVAGALDCWEWVDRKYETVVLRVPPRKAMNFYQASRAATYVGLSDRPPLVEGATLFLEAQCPEGLGEGVGEAAFVRALEMSGPPPWEGLLSGPAFGGAGAQRAIMLALLLRRFRLVICGVRDPLPFRRLGLVATVEPASALVGGDVLWVERPFERLPALLPEILVDVPTGHDQ